MKNDLDNEYDFSYKPKSKLWYIRDIDGNYDLATYKQGYMEAYVLDCDGDGSYYQVKHKGVEIANGFVSVHTHDDFYQAIKICEDFFIEKGYLVG